MWAKERNAELVLAFFSVVASSSKSVHLELKCKGRNNISLWNVIGVKKTCCDYVLMFSIKNLYLLLNDSLNSDS